MTANHCLFCQAITRPITKAVNEHGEEVDVKIEGLEEHQDSFVCKSGSNNGETEIVEHLKSIFIVRKLLDISAEVCEKYLQSQDGNFHPKSWFSVCSECDDIVRKCFVLERKILHIQKELEEEKGKLKALICDSRRIAGDEVAPSNSYICNEIRKYVFGKESETMDAPSRHESSGKNFVRSPVGTRKSPKRRRRFGMAQRKRKVAPRKTKASEQLSDAGEHFSPSDLSVNVDETETMQYEIEAKPESINNANSSKGGNDQLELSDLPDDNMGSLEDFLNSPSPEPEDNDNAVDDSIPPGCVTKDIRINIVQASENTLKKLPQRKTRKSKSIKEEKNLSSDLEDIPPSPEHNADVDWVPSDCDSKPIIGSKESKVVKRKLRKIVKRKRKPEIIGYRCHECPATYIERHRNQYLAHRQHHESGDAGLTCPICGWFLRKGTISIHGIRNHPRVLEQFRKEVKEIKRSQRLQNQIKQKQIKLKRIKQKQIKQEQVNKKAWHGRKGLPFYCDYCPMIYISDFFLNRHMESSHPDHIVHQCSFCSDNFKSNQILQLHIKVKHPSEFKNDAGGSDDSGNNSSSGADINNEQVVPCLHCSESFSSVLDRDYHIAKSHAKILRTCKICGFQGTINNPLGKHLQRKHKLHTLICPFCSRMYADKVNLEMHMKANHSEELGVEPIKCEQCPKTFQTELSLKNHIDAVHKKIKAHICEFCGKAFADKGSVKKHTLLHTETREKQYKAGPFFCKFCNAKFNVRQGLYYHMKNLHSDKYVYRCGKCGKGYEFRNTLVEHELKCTKVGGPEVPMKPTPPKTTSAEDAVNNLLG